MTREEIIRRYPNASESFIRANMMGDYVPMTPCVIDHVFKKPHSTSRKGLNKMEQAWLLVLKSRHPQVYAQDFTLRIGDDCRYTPDFLCLDISTKITAYETKGFMRDDALVKIKVAARAFPWIKFILVTRTKGQWHEKEINP